MKWQLWEAGCADCREGSGVVVEAETEEELQASLVKAGGYTDSEWEALKSRESVEPHGEYIVVVP